MAFSSGERQKMVIAYLDSESDGYNSSRDPLIKDLAYLITHDLTPPTITPGLMDAFQAKLVAAATGSTLTALTSMSYAL